MAATFDPTLPTQKDHIRLLLGDGHNQAAVADVDNPLVTDELIQAKLDDAGYLAALAELAESLAAQYSQQPSKYGEAGGLSLDWSERVDGWRKLAEAARSGKITVPGIERRTRRRIALQTLSQGVGTGFRSD